MAGVNKYHARKITTEDGVFDSAAELRRWQELKLMARAGIITDLRRQVEYELIPRQPGERACKYKADFVYVERGAQVVEDVKGVRTKEYIIKRKLLLWVHHIKIREV